MKKKRWQAVCLFKHYLIGKYQHNTMKIALQIEQLRGFENAQNGCHFEYLWVEL